ncbi:MAG: phosphotransferase [Planctomycetaceae bacterium]
MMPPPIRLPDDAALAATLSALLARDGGGVALVGRRPNPCFSSAATEIVAIEHADEIRREVFLKYARAVPDPEPRCRHDVAYCGLVYDRIVHRLPVATVRSLGTIAAGDPPVAALVLEHLAGALRVNEAPDESGLLAAAAWCGRLHAWGEGAIADPALAFVARYDLDYYRAWAARARRLAAAAGPVPAWLDRACSSFEDRAPALVAAGRTIIHGEYGPQNILWRDNAVHPVDWESAAVGAGEIDLATLLFDWPADTVSRATDAYWRARGVAPPPDFAAVFAAATLYTCLRWLPDPGGGDGGAWEVGLARLERTAALAG